MIESPYRLSTTPIRKDLDPMYNNRLSFKEDLERYQECLQGIAPATPGPYKDLKEPVKPDMRVAKAQAEHLLRMERGGNHSSKDPSRINQLYERFRGFLDRTRRFRSIVGIGGFILVLIFAFTDLLRSASDLLMFIFILVSSFILLCLFSLIFFDLAFGLGEGLLMFLAFLVECLTSPFKKLIKNMKINKKAREILPQMNAQYQEELARYQAITATEEYQAYKRADEANKENWKQHGRWGEMRKLEEDLGLPVEYRNNEKRIADLLRVTQGNSSVRCIDDALRLLDIEKEQQRYEETRREMARAADAISRSASEAQKQAQRDMYSDRGICLGCQYSTVFGGCKKGTRPVYGQCPSRS